MPIKSSYNCFMCLIDTLVLLNWFNCFESLSNLMNSINEMRKLWLLLEPLNEWSDSSCTLQELN